MRWSAGLLILVAGCAGIEGDIRRAEVKEFFLNFTRGRDRGSKYYAWRIRKSTTDPKGGRYQYKPPAHISHFLVERSVRGLGGTAVADSEDLLRVADWLLYALAYDPTASVRSTACEQLGRVVLRLPVGPDRLRDVDPASDRRINTIAQDLRELGEKFKAGEKVGTERVIERMRALAAEVPPTMQAARQQVRALAIEPVAKTVTPAVREAADEIGPGVVRDAILVGLREVACGDRARPHFPADPSPIVRGAAARVLVRVGAPVALDEVLHRLEAPFDPAESDPDVRGTLLDAEPNVRFRAHQALMHMTRVRVAPRPEAWEAWLERHPEWQLREEAE